MPRMIGWRNRAGQIRAAIYVLGMVPAAWYFWAGINDQLGADPMKALEHVLGLWSLRFLVAGLAITPLARLGGPNLIGYRRAIGLLAFWYAVLHFSVYLFLDQQLDWAAIWGDLVKRPYIMVGVAALLALLPLAITSHDAMVRRLGAKAWGKLHTLVYVAAAGGAIHFLLVVKSWPREPIIYTGLVAALLAFRLLRRRRRGNRQRTPKPAGLDGNGRSAGGRKAGGNSPEGTNSGVMETASHAASERRASGA